MSLWLGPKIASSLAYVIPSIIVLVLLAVPPILSGTYAGIQGVDPAARDAAEGMGMRGGEVLRKVELPVRPAALAVRAPQRHAPGHRDGDHRRLDQPRRPRAATSSTGSASATTPQMASGAILVAVLALVMDGILALPADSPVSPGLTGKFRNTRRQPRRLSPPRPAATPPRIPPLPPTVPTTREKHSYEAHDPHRPGRPPSRRSPSPPAAPTTTRTAPAGGGGGSTASAGGSGSITVGSADFSESQVLGEIYAGAIKAKGITVTTKPNIGSRDVYLKALQDGSIDIVPEYTGSLLTFLKGTAPVAGPRRGLHRAQVDLAAHPRRSSTSRPPRTRTPSSSPRTPQSKYSLKSIADLTAHQADITVAAPPEFQTRQQGLVGLKSEYGFTPANFLPLQGRGDRQRAEQRPGPGGQHLQHRPVDLGQRVRHAGGPEAACSAPTTSCR